MDTDGWGEEETTRQHQQHDVNSLKRSSSRAWEAMENFKECFGSVGMLTGVLSTA